MRTPLLLVWFVACSIGFFSPSFATVQLTPDVLAVFDRIDEFHPSEDWLRPFVAVRQSEQPQDTVFHGFLISEDESQFKVLGPDLRVRSFDRGDGKKVAFTAIDLATYAERNLNKSVSLEWSPLLSKWVETLDWADFIVFARAAHKRDDSIALSKFLTQADIDHPTTGIYKDFNARFQEAKFHEITTLINDKQVQRPQILLAVQVFLKLFPDSRHEEYLNKLREKLAKLVEQDKDHVQPTNISVLPIDAQVDEWIFQLRNQFGIDIQDRPIFNHNLKVTRSDFERNETVGAANPSKQLIMLGHAAVPKLIDAIEDDTLTRSIDFQFQFHMRPWQKPDDEVITVGQCAEAILAKLSGRRFGDGATPASTKAAALEWWNEVKDKGEKQSLIDGVRVGIKSSVGQAELLAAKYPSEALEAISEGVGNAKYNSEKTSLLDVLASLNPSDEIDNYLREILKSHQEFAVKVEAAQLLVARDRQFAIEAMTQLMHQLDSGEHAQVWESEEKLLLSFLGTLRTPQAINTLYDAYDSRSTEMRSTTIEVLSNSYRDTPESDIPLEVERLLIHALSDQEPHNGRSDMIIASFEDKRNCDLAGVALCRLFPTQYLFVFPAPRVLRDKRRVDAINHWRSKNGLPSIPKIELRTIPEVDIPVTAPFLEVMTQSDSELKRRTARASYEALGPGALKSLLASSTKLGVEHPYSDELNDLAKSLACQITSIQFSGKALPEDSLIHQVVTELDGARLTSDILIDILVTIANSSPENVEGFMLHLSRNDPSSGLELRLEILEPQEDDQKGWSCRILATGRKDLISTNMSASHNPLQRHGLA